MDKIVLTKQYKKRHLGIRFRSPITICFVMNIRTKRGRESNALPSSFCLNDRFRTSGFFDCPEPIRDQGGSSAKRHGAAFSRSRSAQRTLLEEKACDRRTKAIRRRWAMKIQPPQPKKSVESIRKVFESSPRIIAYRK